MLPSFSSALYSTRQEFSLCVRRVLGGLREPFKVVWLDNAMVGS